MNLWAHKRIFTPLIRISNQHPINNQTRTQCLKNWINEKWANLTPKMLGDTKFYECGKKSKEQEKKGLPSVCRPTIKVNKNTPTLAQSYTKREITKAVNIKAKGGRINWSKL